MAVLSIVLATPEANMKPDLATFRPDLGPQSVIRPVDSIPPSASDSSAVSATGDGSYGREDLADAGASPLAESRR